MTHRTGRQGRKYNRARMMNSGTQSLTMSTGVVSIADSGYVPAGKTIALRLIPTKFPFFNVVRARVNAGPRSTFRTYIGKTSVKSAGLQGIVNGSQKISGWPVASTVGLGRELIVLVKNSSNRGWTASVEVDVIPKKNSNDAPGITRLSL